MVPSYYMNYLLAIMLGFVEGATEFIPISSSGHLIIVRELLGVNTEGGLSFDAVLQLATTCALLVYFWKDIWNLLCTAYKWIFGKTVDVKDKIFLQAIILGTVPAVVFGFFLEKQMDTVFRNVHLVAFTLILGSLLMWYAQTRKENQSFSLKKGIIIGFYQCLSLIPGISRSGATISGGLLSGLNRSDAVRFSFLLSIPILFGAGLKKLFEVRHDLFATGFGTSLFLGSVVAFITGLLAINFLMKYLKDHNLNVFIWYTVILALLILIFV